MSFEIGEEVEFDAGPMATQRGKVAETLKAGGYIVRTPMGHFRVAEADLRRPEPLLHVTMSPEWGEKAIEALNHGAARLGDHDRADVLLWLAGRIEAAKRAPDGVAHD